MRAAKILRLLGLVLVLLLLPRSLLAVALMPGAQFGVTRSYVPTGGYEYWGVWAGRADGHLVALRDGPSSIGGPWWTDYQAHQGNRMVGPFGVSATSWETGGQALERVFYVESNAPNPLLVELRLWERFWVATLFATAPAGKTLAGPIAATRRTDANGTSRSLVFATMTDGSLYAYDATTELWQHLANPGQIRSTSPLAASSSIDGATARVFATTTANPSALRSYRWSRTQAPLGWSLAVDLGKPGTTAICGTVAAAEGKVRTSEYRVYVFCTRRGVSDDNVFYTYSSSEDGRDFDDWHSFTLPSGNAVNTGYAMAAQSRAEHGLRSIDAYVLSTASGNEIWHAEHTALSDSLGPFIGLGNLDGEESGRRGALAATPAQPSADWGGYSNVYYLGPKTNTSMLYRRKGDENLHDWTASNWAAHQAASPAGTISTDLGGTESSTAVFEGNVVNINMRQTIPGEEARCDVRWSINDGQSWSAATTLPLPSLPLDEHHQAGDCSADFDDTGTAYLTYLSSVRAGNPPDCQNETIRNGVFYHRGTAGGLQPNPILIDEQEGCTDTAKGRLDHPWVAVYRDPPNDDRRHFVWYDRGAFCGTGQGGDDSIRYLTFTHPDYDPGQGGDTIQTLHNPAPDGSNFTGGMPVVVVGKNGRTWVVTGSRICLMNANFTDCRAVHAFTTAGTPDTPDSDLTEAGANSEYLIPGGLPDDPYVRIEAFRSFAPSPSDENLLYYAWQKFDPGTPAQYQQMDLWFSRCSFDGIGLTISCIDPRPVAVAQVAGSSQFSPELTVSQDRQGNDIVFLNWYDTREIGAGDCAIANRCYRPMRAVSLDGLTFQYLQTIKVDEAGSLSDFNELPTECGSATGRGRFLGDFHSVTGSPLHSFHVVVGSPDGSPPATGILATHWISGGFWNGPW